MPGVGQSGRYTRGIMIRSWVQISLRFLARCGGLGRDLILRPVILLAVRSRSSGLPAANPPIVSCIAPHDPSFSRHIRGRVRVSRFATWFGLAQLDVFACSDSSELAFAQSWGSRHMRLSLPLGRQAPSHLTGLNGKVRTSVVPLPSPLLEEVRSPPISRAASTALCRPKP